MAMGTPVVIAGMHRSGTSVLANLLQATGVDVGRRLMPAAAANPRGYFEDLDFQELHERVIQASHPRLLWLPVEGERLVFSDADRAEGRRLAALRDDAPVWGFKDPRTCLFLDFWDEVLDDARFVFIFRRPELVVDSLRRRGDDIFLDWRRRAKLLQRWLGVSRFVPARAADMYVYYNERLAAFAEAHTERSLVLDLDVLEQTFPRAVDRMRGEWGLDLGDVDVSEVVERKLMTDDPPTRVLRACRRPDVRALHERLVALATR